MRLHDRLSGHRASIKRLEKGETLNTQQNDTGLAEHFLEGGHNFERDAELHILEVGDWKSTEERRKKESFFICKFKTKQPCGMNKSAGCFTDLYEKI